MPVFLFNFNMSLNMEYSMHWIKKKQESLTKCYMNKLNWNGAIKFASLDTNNIVSIWYNKLSSCVYIYRGD